METNIFSSKDCEYLLSYYDYSNVQTGANAHTVVKDNGETYEIRYRKKNSSSFCVVRDKTVINFLVNKLKDFKVLHIDTFKIMRYQVGDGLAPHYDLAGYGYKGNYMTLSIMLNDGLEFEGGDLVVEGKTKPRNIGSVSTFLRNEKHEVTTVTKGERWTLVIFFDEDQLDIKKTTI